MQALFSDNTKQKSFLNNILDDFSSLAANSCSGVSSTPVDASLEHSFSEFADLEGRPDFVPLVLENQNAVAKAQEQSNISLEVFEQEKKALIEKHKNELESLATQIRKEEALKLNSFLEKAMANLRDNLATQVTDIVKGFLFENLSDQTVEKFAHKLKFSLLCASIPIVVEGNKELLSLLSKYLGADSSKFKFKETEASELSFRCRDKVFATDLAELLAGLQGSEL